MEVFEKRTAQIKVQLKKIAFWDKKDKMWLLKDWFTRIYYSKLKACYNLRMDAKQLLLKSVILIIIASTAKLSRGYVVLIGSSECWTGCLEAANRYYCPTADMKIGFCCSTYEQCPRESRYCSTDLGVSKTLQQFICPFEPFCGSATPNLTATETP